MSGAHIGGRDVVLFLHIGVAVAAFACAAVLLTSMFQMASATDVAVLRSWQRVAHRVEPLFPILVLILLLLGGALIQLSKTSDEKFSFGDGWVIVAISGLIAMEAYGAVILAPAGKRLHELVETAIDGPVPSGVRAAVLDRKVWAGAFGNTGTALGIMFLMPTKPAAPYAVAIVVLAAAVSAAVGVMVATRIATAAPDVAPAAAPDAFA